MIKMDFLQQRKTKVAFGSMHGDFKNLDRKKKNLKILKLHSNTLKF